MKPGGYRLAVDERERHSIARFLEHVLTYDNAQAGRNGTLLHPLASIGPLIPVGGCDPPAPPWWPIGGALSVLHRAQPFPGARCEGPASIFRSCSLAFACTVERRRRQSTLMVRFY